MIAKRIGQPKPPCRKLKAGLGKRLVLPHVAYGLIARCLCRPTLEAERPRAGAWGSDRAGPRAGAWGSDESVPRRGEWRAEEQIVGNYCERAHFLVDIRETRAIFNMNTLIKRCECYESNSESQRADARQDPSGCPQTVRRQGV